MEDYHGLLIIWGVALGYLLLIFYLVNKKKKLNKFKTIALTIFLLGYFLDSFSTGVVFLTVGKSVWIDNEEEDEFYEQNDYVRELMKEHGFLGVFLENKNTFIAFAKLYVLNLLFGLVFFFTKKQRWLNFFITPLFMIGIVKLFYAIGNFVGWFEYIL